MTLENIESSFCSHALAYFVLVMSISSICVVGESAVILLDLKIGLSYTHLLREIIYEIDSGKANEPCYQLLSASNEVGR